LHLVGFFSMNSIFQVFTVSFHNCKLSLNCSILEAVFGQKDRLCGLVVRVSGYRYRGPGFDSRRYQIF